MQFINNGPEIPEELLQAHEDGNVVFFCGAGISYPADLPGFKELVDKIYINLGTTKESIEQTVYEREQYDATLELLERRYIGKRKAVREALAKVLQPTFENDGATDTHQALLQLGRNREGMLRLVTTNFDRIFEHIATSLKHSFTTFVAPMLPIPKNSRWDGLVYLHGLLPADNDESALQRLVVSSGDFGLAYLTERWAARFVGELFRNYVVCFVGYSINDPVLRYMMDALAADRMLGEMTPQAYAFADFESGKEQQKINDEWKAKGVTPILYEVPSGTNDHSTLHRTLKTWAEIYRDGVDGKERIVVEYALTRPSSSTQQDNFVGRMLWALSDKSGLPAKRFAEFNPAPSLDWLEVFSEPRFSYRDLSRFGVSSNSVVDDKLQFSLFQRPAPYTHSARMSFLYEGRNTTTQWDDVMGYMGSWLMRHLNDPNLIFWITQRGGQLHERFQGIIENELNRYAKLEQEGTTVELDEIRQNAPNAIPSHLMQKLWRLLLTGRIKSPWKDFDLYQWRKRFNRYGLTASIRLELREHLAPVIALKKPFRRGDVDGISKNPEGLWELVDWELVLATDHARSVLKDLNDERWRKFLPLLLNDFQQLLLDALDLFNELGETDEHNDPVYWDLPSISSHWQNKHSREWAVLIELVRDAWLVVHETEPKRAKQVAEDWFELLYPTFKRLALFAASQDDCITSEQWVDWLVSSDAWCLWAFETHRETMRLLVLQGSKLSLQAQNQLEEAILNGPLCGMYRADLEPERWQFHVNYSIWIRFAKLQAGGGVLGETALYFFETLSKKYPEWMLQPHERDEFLSWISGTGDPDYQDYHKIDIAPRKRQELVQWLQQPQKDRDSFYSDNWRETCQQHPLQAGCALADLAKGNVWLDSRWDTAFYAWSEKGRCSRTWQYFAPTVNKIPEDILQKTIHGVTWWLKECSTVLYKHEDIFFDLCKRILGLTFQNDQVNKRTIFDAINHPIGHITKALLNLWFKRKPNDNDTLPADIEPFFTQLCHTDIEQYRYGRVLLASNLLAFFRVDRSWTEKNLLPLFDWNKNSIEAKAAWEGFLWSPRFYQPLFIAFQQQFLETVHHYNELGEVKAQYPAFLTYVALRIEEGFSMQDFVKTFRVLPQEGLETSAHSLCEALESSDEQREEYWCNRIQPFLHNVWPKSRNLISKKMAASFVQLSIAARNEFPTALSAVFDWLQPLEHPYYELKLLNTSKLSERFPDDALKLLHAIIDNQAWLPEELSSCLHAIAQAKPELTQDSRYKKLDEYARQKGVR